MKLFALKRVTEKIKSHKSNNLIIDVYRTRVYNYFIGIIPLCVKLEYKNTMVYRRFKNRLIKQSLINIKNKQRL